MGEQFDVVVVGARCAGSPLATLLSRQGFRVAAVERATFPRDTLSTHIFQAPGINFLARLGVLERVRATGAEPIDRLDFRQNDFRGRPVVRARPGDVGGLMSVRRFLLDPILADAAAEAGAEMLMGTRVVGLTHTDGRVSGVRVAGEWGERRLSARLVVGADGRNSTVARLTGARKYHVVPSERFGYWGYFEGVAADPEPAVVFHHWDGRCVLGSPTDSGLYLTIVLPNPGFLPEFRSDRDRAFLEHATACAPVAEKLSAARRVGKLFGVLKYESYFRESAGPGWVLVGDAGQFKDPTPGQGMTDAFRQSEALAAAIGGAIEGPDAELDEAVASWARWRDRDAFEHHWLACDLGAAGSMPDLLSEMMRRLDGRNEFDGFVDIFQHRTTPSRVVTPPLLLSTTALMLASRRGDRRAVLRELGGLVATEAHRQRLRRRPVFVDPVSHPDVNETEVREEALA
jgi:2-polyprenyl-6-methoxyphenol hydroxylase-like FAD-dependent oxidoreductase